ncbi:MAG: MucR family transcriptional regulator [Pseudomonadota bacterium]
MTRENYASAKTEITAEIVAAYVSNNPVTADQLPNIILDVFESVARLKTDGSGSTSRYSKPAVPVRKSLQQSHLICLECGKNFKSLKRHLNSNHNLAPEQYRKKWGLKPDYPMVAPAYAEVRSNMARLIGLGTGGGRRRA